MASARFPSKFQTLLLCLLFCSLLGAASDDESIGPFPSWTNVKLAYGAKGDGVADDTSALQRALDELKTTGHGSNLYLPPGTYRITGLTIRSREGIGIIGADPATTILKFAGPSGGTLLKVDSTSYSRFDRLTFDGSGTAGVLVDQAWNCSTSYFDTGNQYADDVFKGGTVGLQGGANDCGFAETTVLRSKFLNLPTGISLLNFNALDLWVWYSLFDHCGIGVTNALGAGNFHVYNSVFRSSSVTDMSIINTGGFNIRNNFSSGSKAFWTSYSNYNYPAQVTIQGNSLLNVVTPAIDIGNQGPATLIDNRFQSSSAGPVVTALSTQNTDLITVGNTFSAEGAISVSGSARWTSVDDAVSNTLSLVEPVLPDTPPNLSRAVIEVAAGATASAIQAAITSAAQLSRAIVHLPEGSYSIDRTITIPANADLQLVGDGYFATRLNWTGTGTGPVLRITGPSRAILREFTIAAGNQVADGVVIDGVDQRGSRIYMQQPQLTGSSVSNLWMDGLDYALVDLRNIVHGASPSGASVKVAGGPQAAVSNPQTGGVDLFSGGSSNTALSYDVSNGGKLLVRDTWYETSLGYPAYAQLSGSGSFTLQGSMVSLPPSQAPPAVSITNWHGNAALATDLLGGSVVISGDGTGGQVLGLGLEGGVGQTNFFSNQSSPSAQSVLLNSKVTTAAGRSQFVPDQGSATPALIRQALAQTRAEQPQWISDTPAGTSDVRLYRVWVGNAATGVHILTTASGCAVVLATHTASATPAGGSSTIPVSAATGCSWSATSNANWVTITAGASGNRDGSVYYSVPPNPSATSRTTTVTIGDQNFTITQAGVPCTFTIAPTTVQVSASGGTGTVSVTASASDCTWTAASGAAWLLITAGSNGTGSGAVGYSAGANNSAQARVGNLTIAGQTFTLTQVGQGGSATLTTVAETALFNTYSAFTVAANTAPQTRSITLVAGAGPTSYTASLSGTPVFVSVNPSTGTTPATITLTADPTGLSAGTYVNIITFSTPDGQRTAYTVSLTVQAATTNLTGSLWPSKVGIFRSSSGLLLLDRNGDGICCTGDLAGIIGQSGDVPLAGDWSGGTGVKKFGLYRPSTGLFLLDVNNSGTFDAGDKALFLAVQAGDVPVVGDWTGTGVDRVGVFRNGTWYLDINGDGSFTGRAYLGQAGDIPLVGNWNGVGKQSKVGIYRPTSVNGQPGNFFLVDANGDGLYTAADPPLFFLGQSGDLPLVGDWSGDGKTKVGIFRPANSTGANPGLFILDQNGNYAWDGPSTDKVLFFAPYLNGLSSTTTIQAGDIPVTGNWVPSYGAQNTVNLQGRIRTGIYRPSTGTFFLDVSADGTFQAQAFLGQTGDVPVGVPLISAGAILGVNTLGN